uniref:Uncharacterized protein n=1 Tax=Raoultella ornithinolytica TaxID=54291 RepID=A0A7G9A7V2_RAOOR|nr:Hypothetical protein [Raoultella ornithinolytica]URZ94519.1 Hypothetical protein [Raoultella ornithinolytica]UUW41614.1 hypothetical protein [Leclercia sp. 29361]
MPDDFKWYKSLFRSEHRYNTLTLSNAIVAIKENMYARTTATAYIHISENQFI